MLSYCVHFHDYGNRWFVLILVLMEYALLQIMENTLLAGVDRLNPCSNGICSLTYYGSDIWSEYGES